MVGVSLDHQCHLYRCGICSSWWKYGLNYPQVIGEELAREIEATIEPPRP
ncbi:hypothetical protein [Curtobacterium sp. UNCCL20]|nr:hypothetical protein [Curtobacterium sp. UNCCL20]